jgi:hypothetical protein
MATRQKAVREHRLEVADVFREHGEEFLKQWGHTVSPPQRKALRDIGACCTAALARSRNATIARIASLRRRTADTALICSRQEFC